MGLGARERVLRTAAVLGLAMALGCAGRTGKALRYRAERMVYKTHQEEAQLRVTGSRPDSTRLIRLRDSYGRLRKEMPPPYDLGNDSRSRRYAREITRQVGLAELEAARLAMEAHNPGLALESASWVASIADPDTGLHREADLSSVLALRALRRFDDAVALMHEMLRRYPPAAPPDPSREDMILKMPDVIIALRRDQGDDAGVRRELNAALGYYRDHLGQSPAPLLEQQLRVRIVRTLLQMGDAPHALDELTVLERLSSSTPALAAFGPEILYSKARVQSMLSRDPAPAISLYDRVVASYPASPFAPLALVDGGVLEEKRGHLKDALARYRQVTAQYPKDVDSAPIAQFRAAMVLDATGDWVTAKQSLESLPVRFPQSRAAAEAPLAVVSHYKRIGERDAQKASLARAVGLYRRMIADDSTSAFTVLLRWNIVRVQIAGEDWQGALAAVDEIASKDRGTPLAAQALIEGARVARAIGDRARSQEYVRRLKAEYPDLRVEMH